MACLNCKSRTQLIKVNRHLLCPKCVSAFKKSTKAYHLTDCDPRKGTGRSRFNAEILEHVLPTLGTFCGAEQISAALNKHSYKFAGRVETERRVAHVHKYFHGQFDEKHRRHTQRIARFLPEDITPDHLLNIAISCLRLEGLFMEAD
nr:PREDICTED: uncharacterized protein LOC109043231 isoform X1 [Bemisia tabaci]XP_018915911.1 PREDICTED: uncharacterized protein LOC109043231 isoform X1 [Bemisia tabaci]XP_018915912.1 PREDICTED: uncharacterized protein LOC109043231 isoform X1 [Bemisia tabaci]